MQRRMTSTMRTGAFLTLLVGLGLLLAPGEAVAQTGLFFDEFGGSYKSSAMGQAFTALADDYSAAYYNPAGLSQIRGIFENATGYFYAKPDVWARFPGNESIGFRGQPSSRGLFTGVASSLDMEQTLAVYPWFRRFSFGLLSWINLPEISQYHAGPVASRPHFLRHDMRFQLVAMVISVGFEVFPWLSIGGGIIPSLDSFADQHNFAGINRREDLVMGQRLSIHQVAKVFVVPVAGILVKPPVRRWRDRISVGVSYRGENKGHHGKGPLNQVIGIEGPNGDPIGGIPYPPVLTVNLVSFAPRQVSAGIAAKPFEGLTLAYDMTWKEWSRYLTYIEEAPNPAFGDTFTHRFGVEYAWHPGFTAKLVRSIDQICFRGGYYHEPSPVKALDPRLVALRLASDNIFDSAQDVFSTGLCITLAGGKMKHDLEVTFQYHRFREVSRMAFIDAVYAFQNNIPIRDAYIPATFGGSVWGIGGSYQMRF